MSEHVFDGGIAVAVGEEMPKLVLGACVRGLVDIGACGLALAGSTEQIVGGGVLELELVGVADRSDGAHIRAGGSRVGAATAAGRRAGISGAAAPDEQGDAQKRNGGRTFANPAGRRNHAKSLDVSGYKLGPKRRGGNGTGFRRRRQPDA